MLRRGNIIIIIIWFVFAQSFFIFHKKVIFEKWDVFRETQSKRLKKLQNRAAKIIRILNISDDVGHTIALRVLGGFGLGATSSRKEKNGSQITYKSIFVF